MKVFRFVSWTLFFCGSLLLNSVGTSAQTTDKAVGAPANQVSAQNSAQPTIPKRPTAILHTTAGDIVCELYSDKAPKTVANFIGLSNGSKDWTNPVTGKVEHNHPLYGGVIFHRVIPGFMIQGGDPTGTGNGSPGYKFDDELLPDLLFDRPGRLAMANSGPNTNGSQFFITEKEVPALNPCLDEGGCMRSFGHMEKNTGYTIFGQCDGTVDLVKTIEQGPCKEVLCSRSNSRPDNPVKIVHIEIKEPPKAET